MGSGGKVNFQTPTALYEALAGQGGGGLFGAVPFPQLTNGYGYGQYSPYLSTLQGIETLLPSNVYKGAGAGADSPISSYVGNEASVGNQLISAAPGALNYGQTAAGGAENAYNTLMPYAGAALQQGFDPQNALYTRLFQQQQDQANAENAMAGVATTPYGAGLVNQGSQDFNLNWQNNLLQREATGANTASQLAGTGVSALGQGANALATGANTAGNLLGAGGQGVSALTNLTQQQIQDYLAYISANTANSAAFTSGTNAATNAGAASTNALANAQTASNSGKGGIGSALGGIGDLAGKFATGGKG